MSESEKAARTAQRVQQLEDRFAIQDPVAAYCRAINDRDLEGHPEDRDDLGHDVIRPTRSARKWARS